MYRRFVTVLAVLPMFATALLSSGSPAAAAAADSHWVSGTYQLFIQGYGTQTLVLLDNHTVGPPNSGTWSVAKPKHEVQVNVAGGQAPIISCLHAGLGPTCYFSDQYSGPKTPTGIASQADPGVANAYLGGVLLLSEPCWAVRTGTVRSAKT